MPYDNGFNDEDDRSAQRVGRGLVVSLLIGAVVFLGLVLWLLRAGGSIWR